MYVSGLKLGLTTQDLKRMPYMRLANMIQAWNEANAPKSEKDEEVREATQADIQALAR